MCLIIGNTHTWPVPPAHSSSFWMHCGWVCANTAITLLISTATRKLWMAPNKHMYENTTKCWTHEEYYSWVYHHSNLTCDPEEPYSQKLSETQPRMYMISIHRKLRKGRSRNVHQIALLLRWHQDDLILKTDLNWSFLHFYHILLLGENWTIPNIGELIPCSVVSHHSFRCSGKYIQWRGVVALYDKQV